MDFVIHRHAEIALVFSLAAVAVWWLARRRSASAAVQRPLTALCVLLALQGAVGLDQYETHLPTELVWVHVGLACGAWIGTVWAVCAAGRLRRAAAPADAQRAVGGSLWPAHRSSSPEIRASRGEAPVFSSVVVLASG